MDEGPTLDAHDRVTVERLYRHPLGHNIEWRGVLSLLESAGSVTKAHDGRFVVTIGAETETFDAPRDRDIDAQQVVDLRRMLRAAGIAPEST